MPQNGKTTDERGKEYQDWIMLAVLPYGLVIQCYSSREYQLEHGESANGYEIKFDDQMESTGNVFLEYEEKRNPNNPNWIKSGFMRDDSDHYLIGNYSEAFLFSTKMLRWMYAGGMANDFFFKTAIESKTKTSRGALMRLHIAGQMCCTHFRFKPNTTPELFTPLAPSCRCDSSGVPVP